MRDDAAPGPLTQASAPQAPGRLGREDARSVGVESPGRGEQLVDALLDDGVHILARAGRVDDHEALRLGGRELLVSRGHALVEVVRLALDSIRLLPGDQLAQPAALDG